MELWRKEFKPYMSTSKLRRVKGQTKSGKCREVPNISIKWLTMWKNSCSLYIDFIQMQWSIHPIIYMAAYISISSFSASILAKIKSLVENPSSFSKNSVCADELDPSLPAVFSPHRLAGSLTETPLWLSLVIEFTSVLTYISSSIFTQTTTHSTCCFS